MNYFIQRLSKLSLARAFLVIIIGLTVSRLGISSSVSIPIELLLAPAVDLIYGGAQIDRDQAIDLIRHGIDISTLDPVPNEVWDPDAHLAKVEDPSAHHYPPENSRVEFDSDLPSSTGLYRTRVLFKEGPGSRPFQMMMGLSGHASLARNALLRRLGYNIPSPQYYSSLTVSFSSLKQRESYLDSLSDGTLTARKRWIRNLPEKVPEVTFQDVILEPAQIDVPMYHWGVVPASHLKGRRGVRALIVPMVLLDVQESINLYSYELGKIFNNGVVLTYPYADSFAETTFQDARWIARKIAALTRRELENIVKAGRYPPDVAALVTEKLVARRNQMVQLFDLTSSLPRSQKVLPYSDSLTVGKVKSGKLTQGSYEGYAARFVYGDPDSPLRKSELGKYLLLQSIVGGLSSLTYTINNQMQIQSINDLQYQHQKQMAQQFIEWAMSNPTGPYSKPLNTWGGPFGGFGIQASREVVSGTFYGTSARIQIVDNVGINATLGFFGQLDGITNVIPTLTANVMVQRNYLHIRPMADMDAALKTDWTTLFVPHFINQLVTILKEPKSDSVLLPASEASPSPSVSSTPQTMPSPRPAESGETSGGATDQRLQDFLDTLKEGEMLVITDSVVAGVKGKINIPIPLLLNPALAVFNPAVGVGAGATPTIFRRTTFIRTVEGIQIYLENAKVLDLDIEFNFNWWINVLKLRHNNKYGLGDTRAFLLDKEAESDGLQKKLVTSLRALLSQNDSEILEENFKDYQLHHKTHVTINRLKFLWWKGYQLEEKHHVDVSPPTQPEKARTLFSTRYIINRGLDVYSFFSDIVTTLTSNMVTLPGSASLNPSNSFLGSANWVNVLGEAETTVSHKEDPVCLVEHHFGGWLLSKSGLFKILDLLEEKVKPLLPDKPLIRRDEFATTTQLQMYEILSTFIVYKTGIEQLKKTILNPSVTTTIQQLIKIEGKEEMDRWCGETSHQLGSLFRWNSYSDWEDGDAVFFPCLKPWMRKVLKMRNQVLNDSYSDTVEARVIWQTRLIRKLERDLDFHKLATWIGKENYFFQIKISGFRKNDENGDSPYVSDSIGSFNEKIGAGPFREFVSKYGFNSAQLRGQELSDGL